jgi:hypothetical protein
MPFDKTSKLSSNYTKIIKVNYEEMIRIMSQHLHGSLVPATLHYNCAGSQIIQLKNWKFISKILTLKVDIYVDNFIYAKFNIFDIFIHLSIYKLKLSSKLCYINK